MSTIRIAVSSTDGIVVNQHFGRTSTFYILDCDYETGDYELVEAREVSPVCQAGNHDNNDLANLVSSIADCDYVLVSQIGRGAENELDRHGIESFAIPGIIEESVSKLSRFVQLKKLLNLEFSLG